MADKLVVDTAALRAVGQSLIDHASAISDLVTAGLLKNTSDYGNGDLGEAAQQFSQRWARGLTDLTTQIEARGHTVLAAADTYEVAEADAARGAAGAGGATMVMRVQ